MASQSVKQQIYQSIANSQVQQVMAQKREQEIAQLQAQFDAWNKQQDEIANLQAQYDSWLAEQPKPVQQPTVSEVKTQKIPSLKQSEHQNYVNKAVEERTRLAARDRENAQKEKNAAIVSGLSQRLQDSVLPKKKEENVSKIVEETKKDEKPKTSDKYIGGGIKQLDNVTDIAKDFEKKGQKDLEEQILNSDRYVPTESPQLTPEQEALEKQILNSDDYQVNEPDPLESRKKLSAFGWGVSKIPFLLSGLISNGIVDVGETLGQAGATALDDLTGHHDDHENLQKVNDYWNAKRAQVADNLQWMNDSQQQSEEENPLAYGAGKLATQAALYAVTNPLFDKVGTALGAGASGAAAGLGAGEKAANVAGKVASIAGNQVGQNLQDVALDTIPRYNELKARGLSDDEINKTLWKEAKGNAIWNGILGAAGEIPGLLGKVGKSKAVQTEDIDNLVKNVTRQSEEAVQNIENLAKQMPEVPKNNIPSLEELRELEREASIMDDVEDLSDIWKNPEAVENTVKANPEYAPEVQDKILSDFEEIYRSMDNMNKTAIDSGNAKALEKFEKLQKSVFDYEETIWKSGDPDEINKAKKAADAARQSFIREMKKIDPSYTGDLTGTKLGNAEYRIPRGIPDEEAEEMVNDWVKQEMDNPNRFVEDVSKRNAVMAEDTGLVPEPEGNTLTFDYEKPVNDAIPEYKITEELDTPDNLKERGQSKHIRNAGTPMKMEDVAEEVAADFEKDPDMYRVLRNADTKARAEEIYNTSDNPEAAFRALLDKKDPAALPLGHQLAKDYSAAGNHDMAAQIYRDMGKALTESGQFSQAAIINMVKNDPMTALQFAQKEIDSLNEAGRKQFGDKWKNFKLNDDEIKAFENIKSGDTDAIKAVYDNIGNRLGKEYPTTLWDKIIEARRVAMLFNPRTNVRNLFANPPTLAMRWMSDRVEALGQNAAHLINPDIKVTQSLYGSGVKGRQIATEAFNSPRVKALLEGSGSKSDIPNLKSSIMKQKQVFKGTAAEKWIDKVTDGGIQRLNEYLFGIKGVQSIPETVRNATYKLLDLGDSPFVKENFIERLGSYISATGIKSVDDIPDEAIDLAWEEAMKATYKDNSWAVQGIKKLKGAMEDVGNGVAPRLGSALSQSTIPFVQAPGNIAARMVDYSPAGAIKGIGNIISNAKANNLKGVEKGIEEAAKGLTGTGLIALGMKLKEAGIITGTYSSDKDQKAFEKMNGFKEFAFHLGDKYFTYGWAQPWAQTMMVGTLLQDAIDKSDEYDSDILRYFGYEGTGAGKAIGVAREGTKTAVNSWFNESPLKNFAELLKGNSYEQTDIAGNLWENGVSDFASALVPSVVNATAKVVDTTQRNTYNPDNQFSSFINANVAKIPGLSKTLPAKYDTWGREMKHAESAGAAAAAKYAIPGEYSYDKGDAVDDEINRLFNEGVDSEGNLLQDNGVFPIVAPNKVGDKTLNNKEVSEYQKDMGERSREAVEAFINSDAYKTMDDPEKVEVLKNIYNTSNAITKRDKFDTPLADNSTYKSAVAEYDKAGGGEKGAKAIADYYTNKKISDQSGLDSDSNAAKAIQKDLKEGNTEAAQEKIDAAQMLPKLGLSKPGPIYTYYNAQEKIPSLTVEDFAKTYKSIDADGNQGIKQAEIIDYLNKNNIKDSDEAMDIWSAYGKSDWKKEPAYKDGKWYIPKK